jgi:hypothetical protein
LYRLRAALVGVLAAAFLQGAAAAQAPPPEAGTDPADLVNGLLSGLLGFADATEADLQAEVALTGGVPFKTPVPLEYMDRDALKRYVASVFDAEYPPSQAEADARTLVAFDLLPPGTDLRALRARVLEENVVGFYDERKEKRRLYVVSEERRLTPMNQLVLSHELRHALQDQYMGIHDLLGDEVSDFDDRSLALLSLLEGDATFVMERFLLRRLPGGGEAAAGLGADGSSVFGLGALPAAAVPGAPPVVRDQLVLPYFAGRDFVKALFDRGGWDGVKRAWTSPPASSEQVLHPEKYLAGERPLPVRALPPDPPDGRLLREGVLGEAFVRTWLGDGSDAAAAGWGGDAFRCFDLRGRTLLVWRSEWDSASEGQEFLKAAERRLLSLGSPKVREGFLVFTRGEWRFGLRSHRAGVELVSSDSGLDFEAALQRVGKAARREEAMKTRSGQD